MSAPLQLQPEEAIDSFLRHIAPYSKAFRDPSFRFVATLFQGEWCILKGHLLLEPTETPLETKKLTASAIMAGQLRLSELNLDLRQFLRSIADGRIDTPMGELTIPSVHSTVAFQPYGDIIDRQARSVSLAFFGALPPVERAALDWELRAQQPPYHDLTEVSSHFGVGTLTDAAAVVEVTAVSPMWVDYSSPVRGTDARLNIRISRHLDPHDVSVGLRILTGPDRPIERRTVAGADLHWSSEAERHDMLLGSYDFSIPMEAVIACYARYQGLALHYGFLQDPANVINPNRAVVDAFDQGLAITRELLGDDSTRKGWQKNDLEDAVSTLLWIMGFGVSQIGRNRLTADAPDILARTPRGHYLLIEVTTGILKAENKLANLALRTAQVRQRLSRSWHRNVRVQPVLVTSLSSEEVAPEMRQAELEGIKVFTREDLEAAIDDRTTFPSDPDQLLEELQDYLRLKREEADSAPAGEAAKSK